MHLHINKHSEVSAHEQLREQIIYLIGTGAFGIGDEMPSVRALARQLKLSSNTVSKVYSELVRAGWLVQRAGAHHKVLGHGNTPQISGHVSHLDDLIDQTLRLAQSHGYSLQQLANRLRERLLEQPPDHFLIIEPEAGMGEIMQSEIRKKIGYVPPVCNLVLFEHNPALRIGAVLITPSYMIDRLARSVTDPSRVLPVSYSPLNAAVQAISNLRQSSLIGALSVSAAALKTFSGMIAPSIGDLHCIEFFLFERVNTPEGTRERIRRYNPEEYRPGDILKIARQPLVLPRSYVTDRSQIQEVLTGDLSCLDLLICDMVTARMVKHPRVIPYQLLSDDSLERIAAQGAAFPHRGDSAS